MPIHYRPDYDNHIAYIVGEGDITFEECVELIEKQKADVGHRLHEINDYRGTKLKTDGDNVRLLAQMNQDLYAQIHDIRFAVVVDNDVGYGMSRMFKVWLQDSVEFEIFEDYDKAYAWVMEAATKEAAKRS